MNKIDLDLVDFEIINIIFENPKISHRTIAKMINKSQPAVGARIKKHEKLGLLKFQPGINFKVANIFIAMVNLKIDNVDYIMEMAKHCPFIVNAFRLSGKYNLCVLLANTKLEKLYNLVNIHFRADPSVKKISMNLITEFSKDFVLPLDFNSETLIPSVIDGCGAACNFCKDQKIMRFLPEEEV